jgi:hypothetical protein
MAMHFRRGVGLFLGLLLLGGVAVAVWWSSNDKHAVAQLAGRTTVRVVSGSEKIGLLTDPRFQAVMARHGLVVEARKSGSREIATRPDLASFDVAFPAGQPAAAKIRQAIQAKGAETLLVTPMVIASWRPIAEILKRNGIVREDGGGLWIVDMGKLIDIVNGGVRWRDLPDSAAFAVGKSVLVSTTDVRSSNSAAQYLALTSYLINGHDVVTSTDAAERLAMRIAPLFARQGFQERSSAGPFEDYLTIGMGKVPLVWIYEAQYLEHALKGNLKPDMVLLYPRPTIFSKHVAVALSDAGLAFIAAMADPEIQSIAADYGYRVEGGTALRDKLAAQHLDLPDIIDVADAPTHDLLEHMIVTIESGLAH